MTHNNNKRNWDQVQNDTGSNKRPRTITYDNNSILIVIMDDEQIPPEAPDNLDSASSDSDTAYDTHNCSGKYCDHRIKSKNIPVIPERFYMKNNKNTMTLIDLIELGECYHCKCQKKFMAVSLERLAKLRSSLKKLHNMIGMQSIKELFVEQIVYFLSDLEPNPAELLHTILVGPPGVGKSHVIDILAKIYLNMGYLKGDKVHKVRISDLKGKYIGHTPRLTQKAVDDAMGGILVIDEAYSLGSSKLDSFSKEIIDTLNRNLTENAGKFICIIAGYGDEIDSCLMVHNAGLKSRFRFRLKIDSYNATELEDIFVLKVNKNNWSFSENIDLSKRNKFFRDKYKDFKYYGRDMETLLFHTKLAHSNRIFFEPIETKFKITMKDIEMGYERFCLHTDLNTNALSDSLSHIYM